MPNLDELRLLKLYKALKKKREVGKLTGIERNELASIQKALSKVLTNEKDIPKDPERRKRLRVNTNFTIKCQTTQDLQKVYAKNISGGGLFIETPRPPEVGSKIICELQLPGDKDLLKLECQVVWANYRGLNRLKTGVGVKFLNLSPSVKHRIDFAVNSTIEQALQDHLELNET